MTSINLVTPQDIVAELNRIRAEAEKGLGLLKDAQLRYVELEQKADRVEDNAILDAKGTVKDKEAIARLQAAELREQAEIAKVTVDYIKTKLRHLSESMMAVQTAARMVELEYRTTR